LWPTVTERDHRSVYASEATHAFNKRPLSETAGRWATPLVSDGLKSGPLQQFGTGGRPLAGQAATWATPTQADVTGGHRSRSGSRAGELLLPGQAKALSPHLDPATSPAGVTSAPSGLTLNPSFAEWLMDWPADWSLTLDPPTALTACVSREMAFRRFRRRLRSQLSRADLPDAPPAQLDLFG
jgi:hypothetical protein